MDKNMPQPPAPGFAPQGAYMAPPPYPEPQQAQPSVIIVGSRPFGAESQHLTCPNCQSSITTTVETEANTKTHLIALILCIVGLWCCVPCPYCMDTCMVKKHYCPACKAYLGQSEN